VPRPHISKATWDQIKIARASGASYGQLAERTGIAKGTILAHAHRNGWTKDVALARPKGEGNASPVASERGAPRKYVTVSRRGVTNYHWPPSVTYRYLHDPVRLFSRPLRFAYGQRCRKI
jgi:hypothetical protein